MSAAWISAAGAGFALLRYLNMGKMTPGASVSVVGIGGRVQDNF